MQSIVQILVHLVPLVNLLDGYMNSSTVRNATTPKKKGCFIKRMRSGRVKEDGTKKQLIWDKHLRDEFGDLRCFKTDSQLALFLLISHKTCLPAKERPLLQNKFNAPRVPFGFSKFILVILWT